MRGSTLLVLFVVIVAAAGVFWHLKMRGPLPGSAEAKAQTVSIGGVRPPRPQSLDRPTTGYVVFDRETGRPAPK